MTTVNDTKASPGRVEVHLEEFGQHSWWRALLNTVTGTSGSAQYRFIARVAGAADTPDLHVREGATFPLMRWQDLDDEHQPNAFSDIAHQRLEELDISLRNDGWCRSEETGRHWWSRTYEATRQPASRQR
ncbi:conserved hypothetical protein [metagenome]|uniref:Uncharacterized protein n=1 Tax=metagenome TaxID=256318 RepID=A0A2P2CH83_9ZZZZ